MEILELRRAVLEREERIAELEIELAEAKVRSRTTSAPASRKASVKRDGDKRDKGKARAAEEKAAVSITVDDAAAALLGEIEAVAADVDGGDDDGARSGGSGIGIDEDSRRSNHSGGRRDVLVAVSEQLRESRVVEAEVKSRGSRLVRRPPVPAPQLDDDVDDEEGEEEEEADEGDVADEGGAAVPRDGTATAIAAASENITDALEALKFGEGESEAATALISPRKAGDAGSRVAPIWSGGQTPRVSHLDSSRPTSGFTMQSPRAAPQRRGLLPLIGRARAQSHSDHHGKDGPTTPKTPTSPKSPKEGSLGTKSRSSSISSVTRSSPSNSSAKSDDDWVVAYGGNIELDHPGKRRKATVVVDEEEQAAKHGPVTFVVDEGTGTKKVRSASSQRLVTLLAPADSPPSDPDYVVDFLASYRHFMSPLEMLDALVARWLFLPATSEEHRIHQEYRDAVRLRVVNVIKKWIERHVHDFDSDAQVLGLLDDFFVESLEKEAPAWAVRLGCMLQSKGTHHIVLSLLSTRSKPEVVVTAMKRPEAGVVLASSRKKGRRAAFVASDAVDWLIENLGFETRGEAIAFGQQICARGLVAPVDVNSTSNRNNSFIAGLPQNKRVSQQRLMETESTNVPFDGMVFFEFVPLPSDIEPEDPADALGPPPRSLVPLLREKRQYALAEFEALEVARQLTLLDRELFLRLIPTSVAAKLGVTAEIEAYVEHFNHMCYWVATEILTAGDLSERVEMLRTFVMVAEHLERLRNYNCLFAVIGGLHVSSVSRLRLTWKQFKADPFFPSMERLFELTSPEHNYSYYRKQIGLDTSSRLPCIPYFGQYLTDLTHVLDGSPTTLPSPTGVKLINFEKMRTIARIFQSMSDFQALSQSFNFRPVPEITEYVKTASVLSERDLYDLSLSVESRELHRREREREADAQAAGKPKDKDKTPRTLREGARRVTKSLRGITNRERKKTEEAGDMASAQLAAMGLAQARGSDVKVDLRLLDGGDKATPLPAVKSPKNKSMKELLGRESSSDKLLGGSGEIGSRLASIGSSMKMKKKDP
jgi:hypothetical protein